MYSVMDCISKRGAFTFCSPLLRKIPTFPFSLCMSLSLLSSTSISRKDARILKMLSYLRWITEKPNTDCSITMDAVDRSFLFLPSCILMCKLSFFQVVILVLPVHVDSSCYYMYTLQQMGNVGKQAQERRLACDIHS